MDENDKPTADDMSIPDSVKNPDTTEKVEQTEHGFRLKVQSTRGTGTRDEDEVTAEAKAETLDELEQARPALRKAVIEEMDARRKHHPDERIVLPDEREELLGLVREAMVDSEDPSAPTEALSERLAELESRLEL